MQESRRVLSAKNVSIALAILLVLALGSTAYFYKKATPTLPPSPQQRLQDIVVKVEKLMVLPNDEVPTMATVSDPDKLQDQQFFANAETGDIVLIYTQAHKAILYRESLDKIIEVAPINIPSIPQPQLQTGTSTGPIR